MKKIVFSILSLAILIFSIYAIQSLAPLFFENLEPSVETAALKRPPYFQLSDLNGQTIHLSDFRGRIIILTFWTSWNDFSLNQLRTLKTYWRSDAAGDLSVIAINSMEDLETVKKIAVNEDLTFPVLLDQEGAAGESYQIGVLPLTIFINKSGLETSRFNRLINFEEIRNQIDSLRSKTGL